MSRQKTWKPVDTAEMVKQPWLRSLYRLIQPLVEKKMGFEGVAKVHGQALQVMAEDGLTGSGGFAIAMLKGMEVEVEFEEGMMDRLKEIEGPLVLTSNHPYGCIDAMVLMQIMEEVRPTESEESGWKIMANRLLRSIEALHPVVVAVDPFAEGEAKKANLVAMKEAMSFLKNGGLLGFFAGRRVSPFNEKYGAVCDQPWTDHALKLAKKAGARVAVIHMDGQNSDEFLAVPIEKAQKRAMMLAKEIPKQEKKKLRVSFGGILETNEVARILTKEGNADQLRARCYAAYEKPSDIVRKAPQEVLDDVERLRKDCELWSNGKLSLLMFQGREAEALLNEVGLIREQTFRAIGAGSGKSVDVTERDLYYHHLILWDEEADCLAGGYRIGFTQEVIAEHGHDGLYLNTVFTIDPKFHEEVGERGGAMELSRSYILPRYQKNPAMLDSLWKGLALAAKKRGCGTMFGSVTISSSYSDLSQAVLVEMMKRYHGDDPELQKLVTTSHEFEEIEGGERAIPPLVRYYAALGAKFCSFSVEPSFNDAVFCLLRVDLEKMPKRYKKRFLEKD